jgi:hypothetical protein
VVNWEKQAIIKEVDSAMIDLIQFEEPNIVGFRLDGQIDEESFHNAVAAIEDALANNEGIRVYAEVKRVGGMPLETFFENLKVKSQLFRQLEKFEKEAVVSDKSWVETLVKVSDRLFPSVEVRYFTFDEQEKALAWVTD